MEEIQEEIIVERPIKASGTPRFMPAEVPKGVYEYFVVKPLGPELVSYIQHGKIVNGEPQRWLIRDDYGEKILSEWSFTSRTDIASLSGKRIRLTCNGAKKALLEVI